MKIQTTPLKAGPASSVGLQVIRHADVRRKLKASNAKLFDMIAKEQFPKPFVIFPGGRAVGWLEDDVDAWIMQRAQEGAQ
jgi:prophage regulatory protein